jgi:transcriptional regulator with PAS, ATPase and Fis domain
MPDDDGSPGSQEAAARAQRRRIRGRFVSTAVHNSCVTSEPIVRSDALKRVMRLAEQVAQHPAAVLIVGETGAGKEMIAHAIHNHSLRCNQPLVDVNCAAIPEHLVESELFGYEKGAFSGADTTKPGLFEIADKGTLFLDEIGELEQKVQVKLLRVLDNVPYFRLGGSKKVNVDVRLVAATNQNLQELVNAGKFRRDLYHRLAQFTLEVPPLRDRPEDLLGIAEQILRQHDPQASFAPDAVSAMLSYSWPGNVRELRNSIFRAVMLARHAPAVLAAADLRLDGGQPSSNGKAALEGDLTGVERQMIFSALERFGGNQGKAAAALGISRRTLLRKLKSYRENEGAVGTLSAEQQRYYRADVDTPVTVRYGSEETRATLINISSGGAALALDKTLRFGTHLSIYFTVPGSDREVELPGRVAWSNRAGEHGIQFGEIAAGSRADLERWLQLRMKTSVVSEEAG